MNKSYDIVFDKTLLARFNSRDKSAWEEVYKTLYIESVFYAKRLYANTNIEARDVVQDLFAKMWETKTLKFEGYINIKAYLFVSIRNSFLDYITHTKYIDKYKHDVLKEKENFVSEIIETETLVYLKKIAEEILPEEIAKVFKMILEGYEVKEIAVRLGKTQSTVYIQRQDAINILRKKIPFNKTFILLIINML